METIDKIREKELELEKISMTFGELKEVIRKLKAKSEYSQTAIVMLRIVFSQKIKNSK